MVLPGFSNISSHKFFKIFTATEQIIDISGLRFISFFAKSFEKDPAIFSQARKNYSGTIVALQNTCLFTHDETTVSCSNRNSKKIISIMKEAGFDGDLTDILLLDK